MVGVAKIKKRVNFINGHTTMNMMIVCESNLDVILFIYENYECILNY